jgi:hypothetical protein
MNSSQKEQKTLWNPSKIEAKLFVELAWPVNPSKIEAKLFLELSWTVTTKDILRTNRKSGET